MVSKQKNQLFACANGDPRDGFFSPTPSLMIDSYKHIIAFQLRQHNENQKGKRVGMPQVKITQLTHLSRMNFPFSIGRTSLFQILGVLGAMFHFLSKFCWNYL